jgi:propionate catabolism operon transcriptional regulator
MENSMISNKLRIGIFASSQTLIESVQRFVDKKSEQIITSKKGLDDALPVAEEMVRNGVEIIISRRGTAHLLRESLQVPVLSFPHRSLDILTSLKEASTKGKKILLPVFRQLLGNVGILEDLLGIELSQKVYINKESLAQIIIASKREGYEVVVGGDVTQKIAEKVGLRFVEIRTSDEDIAATIEDAKSIALSARAQETTSQRYRAIIDAASDGIIAANEMGQITTINATAASLLKLGEDKVVGRPLSKYIDNIQIDEVLKSQRSISDQLINIDRDRYVLNCLPIILDDSVIGAVTTLRDIGNVIRSEQVVRRSLSKGHVAKYRLSNLVHESPQMKQVVEMGKKYANTDSTILVIGETGTGKEIFVHGIHSLSSRANQPFVSLNCAALPEQLLESELFGYEEGAFTGSKKGGKAGRFEIAHKGTIFLDEIDSTPEPVQTRLLRVLQEKEVMRLGGDRIIPVDVRIIAAAGRDLNFAVQEGKFRTDLFFRLNVLRLQIPPLRKRQEDIPLLLDFFINLFARRHKLSPILLPADSIQQLVQYSWPGNVRQLRNFAERLVMNYSIDSNLETLDMLQEELFQFSSPPQTKSCDHPLSKSRMEPPVADSIVSTVDFKNRLKDQTQNSEKMLIQEALEKSRFQKRKAAEILGMSRTTLWRKLKEFNME